MDLTLPVGRTTEAKVRLSSALAPVYAVLLGAVVRLSYVLQGDFPLGDGGLFYVMTQELQRARYRLPAYTSYNAAGIPFAYPPLGFYLAGFVADLGRWPLLDVFRFLPFAISVLTMVAFYRLSRSLVGSGVPSLFALFAFALLPSSFTWLIMGGGITRSLGYLFALLAIDQAYRLYTRAEAWRVPVTIALAGGAVLSHLAMAWVAALSIALLFLAYGRDRAGLGRSLAVVVGTLAITAPWWGTVIARHGFAPFLAARQAPEPALAGLLSLLQPALGGEPGFPLLAGLALLGVLTCVAQRRFLLPVWLVAIFLLDPRTANTTASAPLALLAGVGTAEGLVPFLSRGSRPAPPGDEGGHSREGSGAVPRRLAPAALAFVLCYALLALLLGDQPLLSGLSGSEREAMRWVAGHTARSSAFLVLTGDRMWGGDRSSEWFPVLAERASVATVQGGEWFPGFAARGMRYIALQKCTTEGVDCLAAWAQENGVAFTHVYVAKRPAVVRPSASLVCYPALENALRCDPRYRVVYDGPGAIVFSRDVRAGAALPTQAGDL